MNTGVKMFDLRGKKALVTGGSRGIGREVALCLARAGADVALWALNEEGLRGVEAEIKALGRNTRIDRVDVSNRDEVEAATSAVLSQFGPIDTLVVNAGINELKPFLEQTPEDWSRIIETNVFGSIHTLHAVGRHMTDRKTGSVITMSSIYSFVGATGNSIYCLSKGGLLQLTKALAVEWARHKVRVNAICPGWVETALTAPYSTDEKVVAAAQRQIPLRRFGQPSDIGPMAVYLAADESQWVTGQSFVIDGGQIAR
jgi:NAD(P)-dependent dehydrogenase (short-subunit alcohol dehydrogenase family)